MKYKCGMYGGKFIPFHKGHLFCLDRAAKECEKVYLLLFAGGEAEEKILEYSDEEYLQLKSRDAIIRQLVDSCYENVIYKLIDITECRLPDGTEDWDAETPLVYAACQGEPDAVYGSEISYIPYFNRAYPNAECIIVDSERVHVPISATMIRQMKEQREKERWLV